MLVILASEMAFAFAKIRTDLAKKFSPRGMAGQGRWPSWPKALEQSRYCREVQTERKTCTRLMVILMRLSNYYSDTIWSRETVLILSEPTFAGVREVRWGSNSRSTVRLTSRNKKMNHPNLPWGGSFAPVKSDDRTGHPLMRSCRVRGRCRRRRLR